ncbi:MAG: flagellar protein FlaG [Halieaceae bacterium]
MQRNVKEASLNAEKVRQINTSLHQRQEMSAQEIGKVQQQINEVVETLNKYLKFSPSDLNFAVDEISNRFMVTVSNEDTGEVIRQVPAEAVLRVAHNIEKLKGLIFDKTL